MREKNLEKRIFLRYSLFFVVLIILVVFAGNMLVYHSLRNRVAYNQEVLLDKNYRQLQRELELMNVITQQVTFNKNVVGYFSKTLNWTQCDNYYAHNPSVNSLMCDELYAILGMNIAKTVINLYNEHAFFSTSPVSVIWEKAQSAMRTGQIAELNETLTQRPSEAIPLAPLSAYWGDAAQMSRPYFSLSRRFYNSRTGKYIGVIQVLRPFSVLETLCQTADNSTQIMLFDRGNQLIVPMKLDQAWRESLQEIIEQYDELRGDNEGSVRCRLPDGAYMVSLRQNEKLGYGMIILQSESVFDASILINIVFSVAMTALLMVVFLMLNRIASRSLTRPLNQLTASLRTITWDNMEMNLPFNEDNSDLQVLRQSYDAMLVRIHESMNMVLESQLREQSVYHLALQSQMSPHFLYNTLSSISALADENGVEKIVEICTRMSDMLRYATNFSSENSTLEQEVCYTQNFLELMKVRYEDRFDYTVDLDKQLSSCWVPRLMLQTIVENCFKHAFPGVDAPWSITISTYAQGDYWIVEVIDNGCGIASDMVESIVQKSEEVYRHALAGIREMPLNELGLLNSLVRLRLIYHDEIRFEAEKMYHGTLIRFGGMR